MLLIKKIFFFLSLPILFASCKTYLSDSRDIVNVGKNTSYYSYDPSFSITLPASFKYLANHFKVYQQNIIGKDYSKFIFSICNQPQSKKKYIDLYTDQLICLAYKSKNLDDFTLSMVKSLKKNRLVDSLKFLEQLSNERKAVFFKSFQGLNQIYRTNIVIYSIGSSKKSKQLFVIEYHTINNITGDVLRFIWMTDLKKVYKGDHIAQTPENALIFESSYYMASLKLDLDQHLPQYPFGYINRFLSKSFHYDYYLPIKFLTRDSLKYTKKSAQERSAFYQALATAYSFASDYDSTSHYDCRITNPIRKPADTIQLWQLKPVPARDYILEICGDADFLLFNEVHHWPQDRAFVRDLLPYLYKKGYRNLALEGIEIKSDPKFISRKYPNQLSGFYLPEPTFGQLVREAFDLGFNIIPYEDTINCKNPTNYKECWNQRDLNQATNIINGLRQHPYSKTLVLAGYDHIYNSSNNGVISLSQNLRKMTGKKIISVDQTQLLGKYETSNESSTYQAISRRYQLQAPTVFRKKDNSIWIDELLKNKVDLEVFFPYNKSTNTPDWIFPQQAVNYSFKVKKSKQPRYLQVFVTKEYTDGNAIPYLNLKIKPGQKKIDIKIQPNQDYIYELRDISTNAVLSVKHISSN